ncbi:Fluconazole resistance protein 1, partial [Madurella mycetomatis]
MGSIPTPPNEELLKSQSLKRHHAVPKPIKTGHRVAKRTATLAQPQTPTIDSHSQHTDGRHKRVWKACERCRMKKTKCDGEFPCKRCKDDGLVCTAGARKKTEYKQLPRGYAEVLENTQFALVATVQKLFSMVRSQQPWEYGEPELNDRGQPVIHDIASKLGCIRPNSDADLPVHSIFPEDEAGLAELARQLEEQQKEEGSQKTSSNS